MANTKNTQTATVVLPDKWFTLEEVAERWTRRFNQDVTVERILRFSASGSLRLAAYIQRPYSDGIAMFANGSICFPVGNIGAWLERRESCFFLQAHSYNARTGKISEEAYSVVQNCNFSMKEVVLTRQDLCLTLEEIERFEREHGLGKPAQMPDLSKPDKLDPRKEKTYLQIIRALLDAANMPEEPYKAAESLINHADLSGLTLPAKRDTIAEKLRDARNLSD